MSDNLPCDFDGAIARDLLEWYDKHARVLPWRAPPGTPAMDPYRVWLSEVMLQQTQVATVKPYFEKFTTRWPDFASLAAADDADLMAAWAGLGYYARARNLLACARTVAGEHDGQLPRTEAGLRALPGVGGYTAAAVAAIAFDERAVVVDANVERVVSRLFAVETPLPAAKPRIHALADGITPDARPGDFAQAMMDLGATICTARAPRCMLCPLRGDCAAHSGGMPETYPRKTPKPERPQRHGTFFWIEQGGEVLLVRRPEKGLLGGMRALPTGPWQAEPPKLAGAPVAAEWHISDTHISHGFTHFRLDVALAMADVAVRPEVDQGEWWPVAEIEAAGLPTVFAKAARAFGRERCCI
nr:A/G-specific adenine glycosylase [Sphingosinithalassobacter tenebrarum]